MTKLTRMKEVKLLTHTQHKIFYTKKERKDKERIFFETEYTMTMTMKMGTPTRMVLLLGFATILMRAAAAAVLDDPTITSSLAWEARTSLPRGVGVHHPITFANATHGFVVTGSTSEASYSTVLYTYEAHTDTWTDLSSDPNYAFPGVPRSFGYGVASTSPCATNGNTAYLGFGAGVDYEFLQDFWEFDMLTGTWTRLADFPGPARKHPAMNYLEDVQEIHVGLGDGDGGNYNDWWSYSIADNVWTQLPDFPGTRRHHPFYFAIGNDSYVGFGHSGTIIESDWYKWDTIQQQWITEPNFESYSLGTDEDRNVPVTNEARVAGTQFAITKCDNNNCCKNINTAAANTLGFVLSGDGDNHNYMNEGEFHVYDPNASSRKWRKLPSHPGWSRWAPGSFVLQGSQQVYMLGGYDRAARILYGDLWTIDVAALFRSSVDTNDIIKCTNKTGKFQKKPSKEKTTSCAILKKKNQTVQNKWCTKFVAVQTHCPSICNKACNTCKNRNDVVFRVRTTDDDQTLYRCKNIPKNKIERKKFCNLRTTAETKGRVKKICPKRCKVC